MDEVVNLYGVLGTWNNKKVDIIQNRSQQTIVLGKGKYYNTVPKKLFRKWARLL